MDARNKAIALTLLSSLLWGSSFVVAGYGIDKADPVVFLVLRFVIAAPIAAAIWPWRRALRNRTVWALAAFNAVAFVLQYAALGYTSVTNVALLISMDLVFVSAASVHFLGERATWRLGASLCLGLAGVAVVELGYGDFDFSEKALWGDMLALGAAVSWTIYIVLSKKALSGADPLSAEELTAGVCIATTLPLLFILPFANFSHSTEWTAVLALAAYLAIFTTILAYVLWYKGLEKLPASTTSVLLLMEIGFAALLAYLFLSDRVGVWTVVGGALICSAAVLAATGK